MNTLIDLRGIRGSSSGAALTDLQEYLSQLEGQPFLFVRITYGDELSLHFGTAQEFSSRKIRRRLRGSYVLTTRASGWRLHSMAAGCIVYPGSVSPSSGKQVDSAGLEGMTLVTPGARVVSADILGFRLPWGIELCLTFSDGSAFFVTPKPTDNGISPDEDLPAIADWELFTPHRRILLVGPGFGWEYADSGDDGTTPSPAIAPP